MVTHDWMPENLPAGPLREAALAAQAGALPALAALLAEHPGLVHQRCPHGQPLLVFVAANITHHAAIPCAPCAPEQWEILDAVLAAGADPDACLDGWSALHFAAMSGVSRLARRLLAAGADRGQCWQGLDGATPLSMALFYAHADTASLLAADRRDPDNLRTAAALGDVGGLDRFFGPDGSLRPAARTGRAFYRPSDGFPDWPLPHSDAQVLGEALSWAARNGRIGVLAALVARGADLHANAYAGTALLWATYASQQDTMRWLLDQGVDPNFRHDFGGREHGRAATPLHLAAQHGDAAACRVLLDGGADKTICDALYDGPPAGWAVEGGHLHLLDLLDPDAEDNTHPG